LGNVKRWLPEGVSCGGKSAREGAPLRGFPKFSELGRHEAKKREREGK
jgi:hypothetical protein